MNKRNYMRELDRIIEKRGGKRPRVLLHSCCGPCSSSVLEYLTRYFDVTLLWYNPNLYPQEEFARRFATQIELIEKMGLTEEVSVLAESWKHEDYLSRAAGLEDEPEGGRRCTECFRLRLLECAKLAKKYGFDYFCTTLTVSRHKDAERINALGEEIGRACGVAWLPSDFKKRDGENRSQQLAEQYGLYRQLYCGCELKASARFLFFYSSGKPWPRSVLSRSRAMPFFSHWGIGAPSSPAFSTMLPSSVKLYQIATSSVR